MGLSLRFHVQKKWMHEKKLVPWWNQSLTSDVYPFITQLLSYITLLFPNIHLVIPDIFNRGFTGLKDGFRLKITEINLRDQSGLFEINR